MKTFNNVVYKNFSLFNLLFLLNCVVLLEGLHSSHLFFSVLSMSNRVIHVSMRKCTVVEQSNQSEDVMKSDTRKQSSRWGVFWWFLGQLIFNPNFRTQKVKSNLNFSSLKFTSSTFPTLLLSTQFTLFWIWSTRYDLSRSQCECECVWKIFEKTSKCNTCREYCVQEV